MKRHRLDSSEFIDAIMNAIFDVNLRLEKMYSECLTPSISPPAVRSIKVMCSSKLVKKWDREASTMFFNGYEVFVFCKSGRLVVEAKKYKKE